MTQEPEGPPPRAPGRAALVIGMLSVPAGLTVVFGLLLGTTAVLVGAGARREALARGLPDRAALAAMGLGTAALLVSLGTFLWAADDLEEFRECRRASLTFAEDERCQDALVDGVLGR